MMKKILLGSTALVGASVLMAGTALAADPPALKLSGYMRFETWFADQDNPAATNNQGYMFEVDDMELHLNAGSTADNGLRYSLKVEIDLDNTQTAGGTNVASDQAVIVDEAVLRFAGNWGILDLGDEDGVQNLMDYDAATIMTGQAGFDGGVTAIFDSKTVRQFSPDIAGNPGDATKISYYTPRIMGVQGGVSFTPDTGHQLGSNINNDNTAQYRNMWSYGVNYVEKFGDIGVNASFVGIYSADGDAHQTGAAAGASTMRAEDATGYAIGTVLTWKEWSVAGGWMNSIDGGLTQGDLGDAGNQWNIGLGWKSGPYQVHLTYMNSSAERGTNVGAAGSPFDDDEVDFISLGAQYNMAPGLDVYAELDFIDVDRAGTTNDNDGTVFMLGTRLSF